MVTPIDLVKGTRSGLPDLALPSLCCVSPSQPGRFHTTYGSSHYRWDHGVGYLIEQGYCWDENRGWHHDDRATGSSWHSSDGRCHQGDQGRGWKSERSDRHPWNRYERDDRGWDQHGTGPHRRPARAIV